jgi:glutamine synthetase
VAEIGLEERRAEPGFDRLARRHDVERLAQGVRHLALPDASPPLPHSLGEALDVMAASEAVKAWFGPTFFEAYLRHKRSELAFVADLSPEDLCARYAEVY